MFAGVLPQFVAIVLSPLIWWGFYSDEGYVAKKLVSI